MGGIKPLDQEKKIPRILYKLSIPAWIIFEK